MPALGEYTLPGMAASKILRQKALANAACRLTSVRASIAVATRARSASSCR